MPDIRWQCPDEIRAAVEPYLLRWLPLVPAWCEEIIMQYEDEPGDGSSLRTEVRYASRDVIFQVCPWWIHGDPETRERHVLHELAHITMGPLVDFTRETIIDLVERDTDLRRVLERRCTEAYEAVVEDFARGSWRMRAAKADAHLAAAQKWGVAADA